MNKIPWIKFYAGDFLNGVADLTPNEIAVYTVVLMRIYDEDRAIPFDVKKIARRCNMRVPTCQKAIESLVDEGKLVIAENHLDNKRARKEREKRQEISAKQSGNVNKRWREGSEKPKEIKGRSIPSHFLPDTESIPTRSQTLDARIDVDESADAIHDELLGIIGVSREKHPAFTSSMFVQTWLAGGCLPEDIKAAVRSVMAHRNGDPPNTMKYFDKAVMDQKATRERPLPAGVARAPKVKSAHQSMLDGFAIAAERRQ